MKFRLIFSMLIMMCWCACDDRDDEEPGACEKNGPCTQACAKMVSCGAFDSVDECQDAYASGSLSSQVAISWCEYYSAFSSTIGLAACKTSGGFEGGNCQAISDCDDFLSCM